MTDYIYISDGRTKYMVNRQNLCYDKELSRKVGGRVSHDFMENGIYGYILPKLNFALRLDDSIKIRDTFSGDLMIVDCIDIPNYKQFPQNEDGEYVVNFIENTFKLGFCNIENSLLGLCNQYITKITKLKINDSTVLINEPHDFIPAYLYEYLNSFNNFELRAKYSLYFDILRADAYCGGHIEYVTELHVYTTERITANCTNLHIYVDYPHHIPHRCLFRHNGCKLIAPAVQPKETTEIPSIKATGANETKPDTIEKLKNFFNKKSPEKRFQKDLGSVPIIKFK